MSTKVIKSSALFVESNVGAHYYAFSPEVNMSRYTEVMANIVLPTQLELDGTNPTTGDKYAYISLGIAQDASGNAVDMGICNHGSGWYPVYNDVVGGDTIHLTAYTAPSTATNAMIVVKPLTSTTLGFYVEFRNAAGNTVGTVFNQTITVTSHTWKRYYRFASLVGLNYNSESDSTYMLGGKFTSILMYDSVQGTYVPWGIPTTMTSNAWIAGYNKCQLPQYNSTTESFQIDHWA